MTLIYLDNNATTACDPIVINTCLSELQSGALNPSSIHSQGRIAKSRLIEARDFILSYFNQDHLDIVFTSGATEAINMVLKGLKKQLKGHHVITSDIEHLAVYSTFKALQNEGIEVTFLQAEEKGFISSEQVLSAIKPNTRLISLMAANNETGVKTDVTSIAKIAKQFDLIFLVDAVAWIGKEPFDMCDGISAIFISGHKFHAPKGIGACIYKKSLKFENLIHGGHQERGKRAGTENLMGIMAMKKAVELFDPQHTQHMQNLRDYFETAVFDLIPDVIVNGSGPRIANTSNLSFLALDGETLLMKLDLLGVLVSHGSACSSGALEPSRVLLNMGLGKQRALSALRFSLSRYTTLNEIEQTVDILKKIHNG
jgi:cysteine desulfurase